MFSAGARRQMQQKLERIWYGRRSSLEILLAPLALLFGAAAGLRRLTYALGIARRRRASRPVVIVGNITVGGTGKTPLVAWLAAALRERGLAPGIVSRGYGAAVARTRLVGDEDDAHEVGDEALLLRRLARCPVAVGRDRLTACEQVVGAGAQLVLCDDGLQHLALKPDFEIAVVDTVRGLGNGRLLPWGPLREPAARLARVDALVFNDASGAAAGRLVLPGLATATAYAMSLAPLAPRPLSDAARPGMSLTGDDATTAGLAAWSGRRVHAIAGIGHPERFFAMLLSAGLQVIAHPLPDHHRFTPEDLNFADDLPVLMTAKDAVKCCAFPAARHWFVPVRVVLAPLAAAALLDAILSRCRGPRAI